ncbi:hypothetical protein EV650_0882 [Kribbella kalugense]|uniref:Peptidase inhibitor family I36 n=1 Tax=Kribbella kalugense TaxID=2512221 RepID=A0A4R8A1N9_9ACTN|nr:hypothetical protein EV650_0882 [Kribbella kalugense]
MTVRTLSAAAGLTALTLGGTLCVSPAAHAAAPPANHCVQNLKTGKIDCFGTFTAAISDATHGRITTAPAGVPDAAQRATLDRSISRADLTADGEVIQGTFFDDRDFGGASWTVVGAGLCDGSDGVINYQTNTIDGWADRISSVQPWANCKIWLYPEPDLTGDRDGPFTQNTAWVGSMMDDRTKSVGFS